MKRKADDALCAPQEEEDKSAVAAPASPSGAATPPRAFAAVAKRRRVRLPRVVQTLLTRFFGRVPAAMAVG